MADSPTPTFYGQPHLLTDGRLDEAASLALLAAFPQLGAAWRARFDQPSRHPDRVRLLVGLVLERGILFQAEELLDPGELPLETLQPWLQSILARCAERVFFQLEQALTLEPRGRVAEVLGGRMRKGEEAVASTSLSLEVRRLWGQGALTLNSEVLHGAALSLVNEVQADARAEIILARQLGKSYPDLRRRGYLDIPSNLFPRRVYRVRRGQRIQVLDAGRCTSELCLEAGVRVPEADEFLMKLVWLRANEQYVLRTANHFPAARLLL